jgi:tRNA 5-methylaminomethyl-2-thiouridine biosynthesis bifunctional protein
VLDRLEPAKLDWRQGQPFASEFDDIYYTGDGVEEVDRVFIRPSRLLERASSLPITTIGELGFGTGLNFTVAAERVEAAGGRLHFISFEKHPLAAGDWARLADLRSKDHLFANLAAHPLPVIRGWHRRTFANGRIILSVYHGDVLEGLADLLERQRQPIDAWFLDGFAPAKNPDMWSPTVFDRIAQCSCETATVATFTAAGAVRRGLEAAGFAIRKVDQRPAKRESLAGELNARGKTAIKPPSRAIVHGAGIAGCTVARHLADQGVAVSVHDPNGIAAGASQMDATVLHGRLLGDGSIDADFRSAAYHYACAYYPAYQGFRSTGALQLKGPNLDGGKMHRIANAYPHSDAWMRLLTASDASALAGMALSGEALWFPNAGIVDLPQACAALVDHPNIEIVPETARTIDPIPQVVACASATRTFDGCEQLEIADVHGQLDWVRTTQRPRLPIVGNGYIVPVEDGCVVGATYEYEPWDPEQATAHNLELNAHLLADGVLGQTNSAHKRAPRCVASDRTPVVGPVDDGRWVSTGHGSFGTASAPLGASILASRILGWIPPVSSAIEGLLNPARFVERQARRGIRHINRQSP